MRVYLLFLFSFIISNAIAQDQQQLLEQALFNLPNVSFKKLSSTADSVLHYELQIRQPLDHQHPENGFFYQQATLVHRGYDRPTVLLNDGYWINEYNHELEKMLDANKITMEYRYFGKSKPDSVQWKYLTMKQASADMHVIRQLFGELYKGKWISTGTSKGGSTSIYYNYFYPGDVDMSVAYVAPLDNSLEDLRIYHFFDTIGTPACRKRIFDFQVFLLKHEKEALEKLTAFSKEANLHYTYMGSIGKAFELAVLEYPFAFWQYNGNCDSVPNNKSLDDYIAALEKSFSLFLYADEGIKMFEVNNYQAAAEGGYYGYNIAPYRKYLKHFTSNPSAIVPPLNALPITYDSTLNQKVQDWLADKGNNIIYIYGGHDTWTAAGIFPSNKVNSKRFVLPNASHSTATIKNMDTAMREELLKK